jgi:type II secretory pathway predicted ATPase ExeA
MFLDFWKLREQPFGVTPDPRYLYFSPGHREALASLFYGIETGRGFLSLVAPPGMGKTTLLFQLLRRWKGCVHSAFLFQTQCNSRELMRYLLADLGLKNDGEDIVRMHSELNDFLFRESKAGRRVVVFIDEAQNLSTPVLETVRLLSNFEAPDSKLMQIVLTGQPELAHRLAQPELSQLRQRIAVQTQLDPFPPSEVVRYVKHRLQVAGHRGADLFDSAALDLVARYSGGIPRLINVLCFNSLSLGFASRLSQITSDIVREAARDVALDTPEPIREIRPEKTVKVARQVPSLWLSFYASVRKMARRPSAQVAAFCLVLCLTALFVAARSRGVSAHRPMTFPVNTLGPDLVSGSHLPVSHPPSPLATAPPAGVVSTQPIHSDEDSSDSVFSYVVQPHDTITSVCLSIFGRCDDGSLNEILRLNPRLKDPDLLEIGQEIRLPRIPQKPVTRKASLP